MPGIFVWGCREIWTEMGGRPALAEGVAEVAGARKHPAGAGFFFFFFWGGGPPPPPLWRHWDRAPGVFESINAVMERRTVAMLNGWIIGAGRHRLGHSERLLSQGQRTIWFKCGGGKKVLLDNRGNYVYPPGSGWCYGRVQDW